MQQRPQTASHSARNAATASSCGRGDPVLTPPGQILRGIRGTLCAVLWFWWDIADCCPNSDCNNFRTRACILQFQLMQQRAPSALQRFNAHARARCAAGQYAPTLELIAGHKCARHRSTHAQHPYPGLHEIPGAPGSLTQAWRAAVIFAVPRKYVVPRYRSHPPGFHNRHGS